MIKILIFENEKKCSYFRNKNLLYHKTVFFPLTNHYKLVLY
jgi:hypothetical protein